MIVLRRFIQSRMSLQPSCLHLSCQKLVNEYSDISTSRRGKVTKAPSDTEGKIRREGKQGTGVRKTKLDALSKQSVKNNSTRNSVNSIEELIKKHRLIQKGSKGTRRHCIMDRNTADKLVMYLKRDLNDSDIIVEFSPGLGVLTETLLTETTNTVIAYESNNKLRSSLTNTLLPHFSPRLQLQSYDFHKFYGYYIINQKEPDKMLLHDFLSPMLRRVGSGYAHVRILGVVYDVRFIRRLIFAYTFQCCLYENISPDLYMCIPYKVYTKINCSLNQGSRAMSLIFQYYFDLETLDVVPKEGFYPIYTASKRKSNSDDFIYLVKISPKKDFFDKVPQKELESFFFFIHTMSRIKKADSLITGMERWIPDCGPEIINNGIHVFAHPQELTPDQLFLAYEIFTSLPSYRESIFHYQRQQFIARVAEKTDVEIETKTSAEILDLEDHTYLET